MTVVASNFERRPQDLYETEPWATEALLRHFPVDGIDVWEPAAGNHMMVDVLRAARGNVFASDIETYSREHDKTLDFLGPVKIHDMGDSIVTNPPYGKGNRIAVKFCELSLDRCGGIVVMLLTAKFDFGKTRHHLFRDNPRFAAKINLVDRISWAGNGKTGTEDHAWYVWDNSDDAGRSPVIYYEGKDG